MQGGAMRREHPPADKWMLHSDLAKSRRIARIFATSGKRVSGYEQFASSPRAGVSKNPDVQTMACEKSEHSPLSCFRFPPAFLPFHILPTLGHTEPVPDTHGHARQPSDQGVALFTLLDGCGHLFGCNECDDGSEQAMLRSILAA